MVKVNLKILYKVLYIGKPLDKVKEVLSKTEVLNIFAALNILT